MTKWTDPDVIAQMEALKKPAADGSLSPEAMAAYQAAMEEAEENARSDDPAIKLFGRLKIAVLPLTFDLARPMPAAEKARLLGALTAGLGHLVRDLSNIMGPHSGAFVSMVNKIARRPMAAKPEQ